jgi:hypothetical protein
MDIPLKINMVPIYRIFKIEDLNLLLKKYDKCTNFKSNIFNISNIHEQ